MEVDVDATSTVLELSGREVEREREREREKDGGHDSLAAGKETSVSRGDVRLSSSV